MQKISSSKRILIGAAPKSLVNFRGDLIRTLISSGHHVTAMAAPADSAVRAQIESLGAVFRSFPVERSGVNPLKDLRTFFSLYTTFCQTKPDIILAYTIKPVIWGGLADAFAVCRKIGVIFEAPSFYRF